MCYCVDFNPVCVEKYCKAAIDSVLKVKEHAASNMFDSLISKKISDFDSLMLDTASVKYWYEFFDKSLDKVLAIHVGIFSALVTFAVAMILIKYWFDHSKFEKKIDEIQTKFKELSDELFVARQTSEKMEQAKSNMEKVLNEYNRDLLIYNDRTMKISECKMKIFLGFKRVQNGSSLNDFDNFLNLINSCMKDADDALRDNLLLWMITEKIWTFIGLSLNSKYYEPYKNLYHNLAFDLKTYTDAYSKRYPGSDLSDFAGLNTFCKSFGIEKKKLFKT